MSVDDTAIKEKALSLADLPTGSVAVIIRVEGRGAFRKRISEMGFIKGQHVKVIKSAPMKDPVEYEIMGYNVSLRRSEAEMILVERCMSRRCEKHSRKQRWHRLILHAGKTGQRLRRRHLSKARNITGSPAATGRGRPYPRENDDPDTINARLTPTPILQSDTLIDGVRHHSATRATVGKKQKKSAEVKSKIITVALVGNPNCGKTTLFNHASGSKEKVGNYAGVTIDAREALFRMGQYTFRIYDLPGTYSITEYSPEELYVRRHIMENKPDVVVNVVDASNLERNLYLTTQLIDMNIKVVIALNMYDELKQKRGSFDHTHLAAMTGIPIVPAVASKGQGIDDLFARVIEVYEGRDPIVKNININYGEEIEHSIQAISQIIEKEKDRNNSCSSRFLAIKMLEGDTHMLPLLNGHSARDNALKTADQEAARLASLFGEQAETLLADVRYGFIAGALKETYQPPPEAVAAKKFDIDDLLTHKIWGFPVFIFFIWLTFHATFTLGSYPMDWIDAGVGWLGRQINAFMPAGPLTDLLVDGIIGGVGGVIIFLPNILILFLFISLMEDTGYMARAAFLMDKLMHKIGLHGKSFIPLIMGFGCNVPAVMATRTLENRNDRLLTMLILPFMSCSARLPVYVLIISAFFINHQAAILFLIYGLGILTAIIMGLFFKKVLFSKKEAPFVMELPPYRVPTARNLTRHMWHKASQYLRKMGTIILFASIIIWALGYYPRNITFSQDYQAMLVGTEADPTLSDEQRAEETSAIRLAMQEERLEKSYIGQMGRMIEPVIQPLGFDWKIGMSIITGMAAKEIVVSSMGVLYRAGPDADENSQSLREKLREQTFTRGPMEGQKVFTPLVAFAFMVFVLIYFPCVAVIAAIKKEANWKWAIFTSVYTTALAWIAAFAVYRTGLLIVGG